MKLLTYLLIYMNLKLIKNVSITGHIRDGSIARHPYDRCIHCTLCIQTVTCRADFVVTMDTAFRGTFVVTVVYSAVTPAMRVPAVQVLTVVSVNSEIRYSQLRWALMCLAGSVCSSVCQSVTACEQHISESFSESRGMIIKWSSDWWVCVICNVCVCVLTCSVQWSN